MRKFGWVGFVVGSGLVWGQTAPKSSYHGWADAVTLRNEAAEVVVVPSIGRVMSFHLAGDDSGPVWNNAALAGKPVVAGRAWRNFGGDKSWPNPQSDWPQIMHRDWPPPFAFDAMPDQLESAEGRQAVLVSAVDADYGIRERRVITLDAHKPVMRIETTYEKVEGKPVKVAVWVITQLQSPDRAFALLREAKKDGEAFIKESDVPPFDLQQKGRLVSVRRDPEHPTKEGFEGDSLIWVGGGLTMRIDTISPDGGSHVEIYTNPDKPSGPEGPLQYVELETVGPLHTMQVGDKIHQTNVYTLGRTTDKDPTEAAERVAAAK